MFGIVERMPESLEMLQYLIDKDNEIPSLSRHFSSRVHLDKILSLPSSNRTDAIVRKIQEDSRLMSIMEEYLRYEITIYNFALHRHESQYKLWKATMI